MALNREQFLAKRASAELVKVELPDGDDVLLRRVSAKTYREYKASQRDKDGLPIPERQAFGDELLAGLLLVDPQGNRMFSDVDVMAGVFDLMDMPCLVPVIQRGYELVGISKPDEDREKNSSETGSIEQS